jgi:hypothetical protein
MDLELLTQKTIEIVRQASSFIQQEAALFSRDKIEYKDLNNLVSYVDKEAEKLLVAGLQELLPEASFITEEGTTGQEPDPSALNWIIDQLHSRHTCVLRKRRPRTRERAVDRRDPRTEPERNVLRLAGRRRMV